MSLYVEILQMAIAMYKRFDIIRGPVFSLFSLIHIVQTGFSAHPASYSMDMGGSFPGGKVAGA
jgi:hypothetical protein